MIFVSFKEFITLINNLLCRFTAVVALHRKLLSCILSSIRQ